MPPEAAGDFTRRNQSTAIANGQDREGNGT